MLLPNKGIKLFDIVMITDNYYSKDRIYLVKKIYPHSDKNLIAYDLAGLDNTALLNVLGKSIVKVKSNYNIGDSIIINNTNAHFKFLKKGDVFNIIDIYNGFVSVMISDSVLKIPLSLIDPYTIVNTAYQFNTGDFVYVKDREFPYEVLTIGYGNNYRLQDPGSKEIIYAHGDSMTLIDTPKQSISNIKKGDYIIINNNAKLDSSFRQYVGRKFEVNRLGTFGVYITIGLSDTHVPDSYTSPVITQCDTIINTSEPILNTNTNILMSTTLDKITIEKFYSNEKNVEAVTITKEELEYYYESLDVLVNLFTNYKAKVNRMQLDFNNAISSDNIKEIKSLIKTVGSRLDALQSFLEDKTIAELLPVEENKTDEDPKVFWNN